MDGITRLRGRPRADVLDQKIGDQVRTRRLLVGMTQEKLGDALGVSFQQIQKYEKGTNRISANRLRQIATALGVPIVHFYEADEVDGEQGRAELDLSRVANRALGAQLQRLARAFTGIKDERARRNLVELAESLASEDSTN